MINATTIGSPRDESPSAAESPLGDNPSMFQLLFERSSDAILLLDPQTGVFVDCNHAAVELMRSGTKQKLLQMRPEDLSPPLQPGGIPTGEKTAEVLALVDKNGGHRFEWIGRRFDGQEVPLEVLVTLIQVDGRKLNVSVARDITERKRTEAALRESEQKFRGLFEASSDGIIIIDAENRRNIDCNAAALKMSGADREWLLTQPIENLAPERQPDGRSSNEAAQAWIDHALAHGPQRFEWMAKRNDGEPLPLEVLLTPLRLGGRLLLISVSRDISERKKTERQLLELNQSLERRVAERTAALTTSEAQFRALVEHAPEAIVVFDGDTGRFLFGNEHASKLYKVPIEKLAELTPADVSPEFQPDGRRSAELAREKMEEALAGGTPVFEWIHRQPDGKLVPTEVRLLRLPAAGRNLIRASIIDNTERKLAERTLRESEAKFRALFEGSSQGVTLHDENQILDVNPAAVRILGCQSAQELLGRHPSETSPPFQPDGESSAVVARRHIQECMTNGSARFEWMSCTPQGKEVPLEVTLTRIQWSGRQIIQAFITDITERKRTQTALAESEARFSVAFQESSILLALERLSDGRFVLVNDAFVNWLGFSRDEILGRDTTELHVWEHPEDREAFWTDLRRTGSIRERECRLRNRNGKSFMMLLSAKIVQLNHVPHKLMMALDITGRKMAEAELRASEARLRESEARFSAAFEASPVFIMILRMHDEKAVLANEALLSWMGVTREEVIDRSCAELGVWENNADRKLVWKILREVGSIRQRECRWRNRNGQAFTILLSADTIQLNNVPHVLIMALDITQRKQAEIEMQKALGREKELSQLKSNFVSMVSHEFRTPLAIIQSSAELLREFFPKMQPAERDEQLGSITGNTRRMAGMMEEILVLSRMDAGKLDFQPSALDLEMFCRRIVDEVHSATSRRCAIEISLASALPQSQADERLLQPIFTNLLSNAVKYSDPGAGVRFTIERNSAEVLCIIRDEGIGIPEEDQKMLFSAFHRGANVGSRPGTGLGLLLVKRCVELHNGKVWIHSQIGRGTTVTIRLPVFQNNL